MFKDQRRGDVQATFWSAVDRAWPVGIAGSDGQAIREFVLSSDGEVPGAVPAKSVEGSAGERCRITKELGVRPRDVAKVRSESQVLESSVGETDPGCG